MQAFRSTPQYQAACASLEQDGIIVGTDGSLTCLAAYDGPGDRSASAASDGPGEPSASVVLVRVRAYGSCVRHAHCLLHTATCTLPQCGLSVIDVSSNELSFIYFSCAGWGGGWSRD